MAWWWPVPRIIGFCLGPCIIYSLYNIQGPQMTFWNLMQDDDAWFPFGCPDPDPDPDSIPDPGHRRDICHKRNKAVLV